MHIYLASRYSRRDELRLYAADLRDGGHVITSRWINGDHALDDRGLSEEAMEEDRVRFAEEDWEDLLAAEVVISFTEAPRGTSSRGGRHVEFGAALALEKAIAVIGHRENVFHCLPQVYFFPTWRDFLESAFFEEITSPAFG